MDSRQMALSIRNAVIGDLKGRRGYRDDFSVGGSLDADILREIRTTWTNIIEVEIIKAEAEDVKWLLHSPKFTPH